MHYSFFALFSPFEVQHFVSGFFLTSNYPSKSCFNDCPFSRSRGGYDLPLPGEETEPGDLDQHQEDLHRPGPVRPGGLWRSLLRRWRLHSLPPQWTRPLSPGQGRDVARTGGGGQDGYSSEGRKGGGEDKGFEGDLWKDQLYILSRCFLNY